MREGTEILNKLNINSLNLNIMKILFTILSLVALVLFIYGAYLNIDISVYYFIASIVFAICSESDVPRGTKRNVKLK